MKKVLKEERLRLLRISTKLHVMIRKQWYLYFIKFTKFQALRMAATAFGKEKLSCQNNKNKLAGI